MVEVIGWRDVLVVKCNNFKFKEIGFFFGIYEVDGKIKFVINCFLSFMWMRVLGFDL